MARRVDIWLHTVIAICGLSATAALYYATVAYSPPIRWIDGSVSPKQVRAGEVIYVTREFEVLRPGAIVRVERQLISGDCHLKCTAYVLEGGERYVMPDGVIKRTRPHVIPPIVPPGKYRLDFTAHWQNSLGRDWSMPQEPPLEIEIIP